LSIVYKYKGAALFNARICKKISKATQGVPRLVNILCHKMLMLTYGEGHFQMSTRHLKAAVKDTEDTQLPLIDFRWATASIGILLSVVGGYLLWGVQG